MTKSYLNLVKRHVDLLEKTKEGTPVEFEFGQSMLDKIDAIAQEYNTEIKYIVAAALYQFVDSGMDLKDL